MRILAGVYCLDIDATSLSLFGLLFFLFLKSFGIHAIFDYARITRR